MKPSDRVAQKKPREGDQARVKHRGLRPVIKNQYGSLLFRLGCLGGKSRRPWPVLLHYHRTDGQTFERQVRYLTAHCEVVSLDQVAAYVRGEADVAAGAVVLTFDDGYRSFFSEIYPVLQRYGAPATVFLVSELVGTEQATWFDLIEWVIYGIRGNPKSVLPHPLERFVVADDAVATRRELLRYLRTRRASVREHYVAEILRRSGRLGEPVDERYRLLTWEQVREMDESDLVTFGGHSRSHPILSRVGMSRARSEIVNCKTDIETTLGHSVSHFAYPNGKAGDFTAETIRVLASAGYRSAVTTTPRRCRKGGDPYLLPRWGISSEDSPGVFSAKARGLWPPWR